MQKAFPGATAGQREKALQAALELRSRRFAVMNDYHHRRVTVEQTNKFISNTPYKFHAETYSDGLYWIMRLMR